MRHLCTAKESPGRHLTRYRQVELAVQSHSGTEAAFFFFSGVPQEKTDKMIMKRRGLTK